ncbi:MAG: tRNA ((37)-N6)-threonylcarbamoyltransferase complex dimerization subunit type 1 TsaB [Verrucomicrobiota bacterium]|jgi:tRNA threonylcarbamoyladenosine biosynthesis protein TsaB
MKVLALDTSTEVGSVALWDGERVAWRKELASQRTHSSTLFPALEEARDLVERIDCLAVGLGPGSYAGVRIAISAAMGLQSVWNCELVGLPSVLGLRAAGSAYRVVGDARRGTWYYSEVADGICVDGPRLVEDSEGLKSILEAGSGDILSTEALPEGWVSHIALPDAGVLAELAAGRRGIVQRDDLEPLYLREVHITLPTARPQ